MGLHSQGNGVDFRVRLWLELGLGLGFLVRVWAILDEDNGNTVTGAVVKQFQLQIPVYCHHSLHSLHLDVAEWPEIK